MKDLIEKLEAAQEGSRELDAAIAVAARAVAPDTIFWKTPFAGRYSKNDELFEVRRYTASLDAALTLVPEHMLWHVKRGFGCRAYVWSLEADYDENGPPVGNHQLSPALALCIAALKARAQ